MRSHQAVELLTETADSTDTSAKRARALLAVLRRLVPFDGAWLALADPLGHGYHTLASVDLDDPTLQFLSGPLMARNIEVTGTDRPRAPLSPSDLPYPAEELPTWADCLFPAGIYAALAVSLFVPPGGASASLRSCPGVDNPVLGRAPPARSARAGSRARYRPDAFAGHRRPPGPRRRGRRGAARGRQLPVAARSANRCAPTPRGRTPRARGRANHRWAGLLAPSSGRRAVVMPQTGTSASPSCGHRRTRRRDSSL